MSVLRVLLPCLAAATLAGVAHADPLPAQGGWYEVAFRLELPHLERWALARTRLVCVPEAEGRLPEPFLVLSDNHPFAACPVRHLQRQGAEMTFELACEGRAAARAQAAYTIAPGTFSGRIAMTMGAKNMTMTEVQTGRRVGGCPTSVRQDQPAPADSRNSRRSTLPTGVLGKVSRNST